MRPLPALVRAHLTRLGWSQAAFARAVGITPTKMSELLRGRKRLSRKRLRAADAWCAALGLTGADAEELIDAMHIAAAEPRVRAIIERQQRQIDQLRLAELKLEAIRVQGRRMLYGDDDTPARR